MSKTSRSLRWRAATMKKNAQKPPKNHEKTAQQPRNNRATTAQQPRNNRATTAKISLQRCRHHK
ncbi:hypothetical protein P5W99_28550 [Paraburkholderia sp. A3BS-1L]|uniref:hypothetical protein n=1 Tax=Paraburkholderia sp. A3BS-1L TaxID=3028375 RepID=UPI003DA9A500